MIYVVDDKGRIDREFAPVMDGTLQGPDEVFRLLEFYLRELGSTKRRKSCSSPTGDVDLATGDQVVQGVGLVGIRCWELVDFYH